MNTESEKKITIGNPIYQEDNREITNMSTIVPDFSCHQTVMDNLKPENGDLLKEQRKTTDALEKLNEQLAPRDKKKDVIFFDEKLKTFIRDTNSVSYTYKLSEKGMNFKLVTALFDHDGFRQTRNLKNDIGSKTDEAVRKKVQKINDGFSSKLRKPNLKLIVGESGAGYRTNPELKIRMV